MVEAGQGLYCLDSEIHCRGPGYTEQGVVDLRSANGGLRAQQISKKVEGFKPAQS